MHYHKSVQGEQAKWNETQSASSVMPTGFSPYLQILLLTHRYNTTKEHFVLDLLIKKKKGFIHYLVKKCSSIYQPPATFKFSIEEQISRLNLSLLFNIRRSLGEPRSSQVMWKTNFCISWSQVKIRQIVCKHFGKEK